MRNRTLNIIAPALVGTCLFDIVPYVEDLVVNVAPPLNGQKQTFTSRLGSEYLRLGERSIAGSSCERLPI